MWRQGPRPPESGPVIHSSARPSSGSHAFPKWPTRSCLCAFVHAVPSTRPVLPPCAVHPSSDVTCVEPLHHPWRTVALPVLPVPRLSTEPVSLRTCLPGAVSSARQGWARLTAHTGARTALTVTLDCAVPSHYFPRLSLRGAQPQRGGLLADREWRTGHYTRKNSPLPNACKCPRPPQNRGGLALGVLTPPSACGQGAGSSSLTMGQEGKGAGRSPLWAFSTYCCRPT